MLKQTVMRERSVSQLDATSKLRISPGSHSAWTSNGRQQTSQSVTNLWLGTLVSTVRSKTCPQNGHWMARATCIAGR